MTRLILVIAALAGTALAYKHFTAAPPASQHDQAVSYVNDLIKRMTADPAAPSADAPRPDSASCGGARPVPSSASQALGADAHAFDCSVVGTTGRVLSLCVIIGHGSPLWARSTCDQTTQMLVSP